MKLKVKGKRQDLTRKLVSAGLSCTDTFLVRKPDQESGTGIKAAHIQGPLYKIPDTTQFNT